MSSGTRNDAAEVLRVPFALTRQVRAGAGLRRLRAADAGGQRTWTFDLALDRRSLGGADSVATNYSAAVVQLPRRIEVRIALARLGFLRQAQPLDASVVEVGTPELQERFTVRATSAGIAAEMLSPHVCEWLTGPGSGFHYEIVHDRVLAYGWRRYLGGSGPLRRRSAWQHSWAGNWQA